MQEWKLPSQLVATDNSGNLSPDEMFLRHETVRRITAEHDLILTLDFIDNMRKKPDLLMSESLKKDIDTFLAKFLDKTINN